MTKSCRIVLVRARNPMNIGAAARAMKNFGLTDLVLVGVHPPVWEEARSAVGARDLLASARAVDTIAEAVADCTLVLGTTSGVRHPLEPEQITPAEFTAELSKTQPFGMQRGAKVRAAILFGSEKTGLTKEELSHCHLIVRIPTESDCPSMNLGQAVAVCCYELVRSRAQWDARSVKSPEPARASSIEALLHEVTSLLEAAGFFRPVGLRSKMAKLRRTLLRLGLSEPEVVFFRGAVKHVLGQVKRHGSYGEGDKC